jgi:hypothetical protein
VPELSFRLARAAALTAVLGALACGGRAPASAVAPERLVWPLPPDTARVEFVRAIKYPRDLTGRAEGALRRLATGGEGALFQRPYGVAVLDTDRLLVADPVAASLSLFNLVSGDVRRLGTSGRGQLQRPCCVSTARDGRIFVSDVDGLRVVVFDSAGGYLNAFGGRQVFTRPAGLVVDEAHHRVYVADVGRHRVTAHDIETGALLFDIGAHGSGEGEFNYPTDLAVDSAGRLYVLDAFNFRVQRFDANGRFLDAFGSAGDAVGHFSRPKGLAVGSDGVIYVVDAAFGNIQLFDSHFALLMVVGSYGNSVGQFDLPAGIAISCDQRIFVADGMNARIQVFRRLDVAPTCLAP